MTKKNIAAANITGFTFNHLNQTIVGSESNFKKAGNPKTPQYEALMTAISLHPNYTLSPIAGKHKVDKKQTYKGLTAELISEYVEIFGNETQKAELAQMVDDKENYPAIKSWFLEYYRAGFTVEKAKREIASRKLITKKATVRKVAKAKVARANAVMSEFPDVSNF